MEIEEYYLARGWTKDGMIPKSKLIELGLDDIAEDVGVEVEASPVSEEV
jgi:hypothetical protein